MRLMHTLEQDARLETLENASMSQARVNKVIYTNVTSLNKSEADHQKRIASLEEQVTSLKKALGEDKPPVSSSLTSLMFSYLGGESRQSVKDRLSAIEKKLASLAEASGLEYITTSSAKYARKKGKGRKSV